MSSAVAMTLPGSRVVLNWWNDLAALAPRRFWFAHLMVHQVETLVEVAPAHPLRPLASGLWSRLHVDGGLVSRSTLVRVLSLDSALLDDALATLVADGLAVREGDSWRAVGNVGEKPDRPNKRERQTFTFADARPGVFLPLSPSAITPMPTPQGWRFDLSWIQGCIDQPEEWKKLHGFPLLTRRVIAPEDDWQSVAVDQVGQALLLFVEVNGVVVAYSVRPDNWVLGTDPVLRCPLDTVKALGGELSADTWRQTWQAWSQQKSLPTSEVEACKLEWIDHRLVVTAPTKLFDRLRNNRSEALKGEAWLIAGSGRVRPAVMLDIVAES